MMIVSSFVDTWKNNLWVPTAQSSVLYGPKLSFMPAKVTRNLNLNNPFISYESNAKIHTTVILLIISGNFEGDNLSPYISCKDENIFNP